MICVVCGGDFAGARRPPEWSYEDICRQCARWAAPILDMAEVALVADRYKHMLKRGPIKVTSSAIPYPHMKVD